jgi:hypothetical protein
VLAPELAEDDEMRRYVELMAGKKDKGISFAALDFLGDRVGDPARPYLIEVASRGKRFDARRRARAIAERKGFGGEIDQLESYTLDLQQGPSCAERKAAIAPLRALKDRRAIPALKKARGRDGGFLGLQEINGCLDKEAKEAIEFLEGLPW